MVIKAKKYDIGEFLQTEEDIAAYLNAAYQDDDPSTFVIALGAVARLKGIAAISMDTGLNRESLYKALNGKSQPKWATVQKVMKSLNVQIRAITASETSNQSHFPVNNEFEEERNGTK